MEEVTSAQLQATFDAWLASNVAPGADGERRANAAEVQTFLDTYVLSDPGTVYMDGAVATALWSYEIGDSKTEDLANQLSMLSGGQVRVTGHSLGDGLAK